MAAPVLRAADSPVDGMGVLLDRLREVDARFPGELGVYLKDLHSGTSLSFRGEQTWYFASGVKLPVAIAVLRGVEQGRLDLDQQVPLLAEDYVDGAGKTRLYPPGTPLTLRFLLEQMMIYSDNTASDVLIRLVGLEAVNVITAELAPGGFQPITSLAAVRRYVYGYYSPRASQLSGAQLLLLKQQPNPAARLALLGRLLQLTPEELARGDLDSAYRAYYQMQLNSGRLSAYAELLERLVAGEALDAERSSYLLRVMDRSLTGQKRIRAGLPKNARFAHKTGTQWARFCDFGVISTPESAPRQLIVAACTRDDRSQQRAELALREVGEALQAAGTLRPPVEDFP
jgi:beta-lactamase class A